jgi:aspartate dehydrogenase
MKHILRFGLLGCGAMGATIAEAFDSGVMGGELAGLYDVEEGKAAELARRLKDTPEVLHSFNHLIKKSDFVIEAASQDAVREYALEAVKAGKSILIMSVGALLDKGLYNSLETAASQSGATIHLPSGALAGVDGLLAADCAGVEEVILTTTKPPAGLRGVRYLEDKGVDVDAITEPTIVFEGSAEEAVTLFQKNINVSAMASLAAGKIAAVRIVADPHASRNTHEIRAKGSFGELTAKTVNVPSPSNPKTSHLACLSAIAVLKRVCGSVEMGN